MAMARQDVWFENPTVGQRSRILTLPAESSGRQFVVEYVTRLYGGDHANAAHLHNYTETFEILKGRARYRLGSEVKTAAAGDRIEIPPMTPHQHPWSDSLQELHVRHTAVADPPDLRGLNASLQADITIQGLARLGLVDGKGLPSLLQLAVLLDTTMPATYLDGMPIAIQRILYRVLAPIGRLVGYKAAYREHGMITPRGFEPPQWV
jgi:quercetin dioxygenase-like cupin family protein